MPMMTAYAWMAVDRMPFSFVLAHCVVIQFMDLVSVVHIGDL